MKKFIIYLMFIFLITSYNSCDTEKKKDPKPDQKLGSYDYSTTSVYFDSNKKKILEDKNQTGVLTYSYDAKQITITPKIGWPYKIDFAPIENSNKNQYFDIYFQKIEVNKQKFTVIGINKHETKDKDGSNIRVNGLYKKSIKNLSISFKSTADNGSYVETTIIATPN